tara:strand:+ start:57 stop:980 length:924 start_codon:yes stop_codon:yes gene_type:complete
MLTRFQYYKNYIIIFSIFLSSILSKNQYDSLIGNYSITNTSETIYNQEISFVINDQLEFLNNIFGSINKLPFKFIIFNDNSSSIQYYHWKWSNGITIKDKIIIKDPKISHISINYFYTVIRHEINHLFLNRVNTNISIPRWFNEGFAMYYANQQNLNYKMTIAKNINNEQLFNIYYLNKKFHSDLKYEFDFAYAYSNILFHEIINLYGEESILKIVQNIRDGNNFQDSFYLSTLDSLTSFNRDIYSRIKSKYRWYNLIRFPNLILIFSPLILIVSFYIKRKRNKIKIKEWEIEEELLEENSYDNEKE